MKLIVLILVLTIVSIGCSDSSMPAAVCPGADCPVVYHEVDQQWLDDVSGTMGIDGWAEWDAYTCDIYLKPAYMYGSKSAYNWIVAHEERHCIEGHFHN